MRAAISPGPPWPALRRFWAAASFTHRALLDTCAAHAPWRPSPRLHLCLVRSDTRTHEAMLVALMADNQAHRCSQVHVAVTAVHPSESALPRR